MNTTVGFARVRVALSLTMTLAIAAALFSPATAQADDAARPSTGVAGSIASSESDVIQTAVDLYNAIGSEPGNFAFSPLSVAVATAMLYAGASPDAAAEIAAAMRFPPSSELDAILSEQLRRLQDRVAHWSEISIGNWMWVDDECRVDPRYARILSQAYGATAEAVDFGAGAEGAAARINERIAAETHGRIPKVISPEEMSRPDRLVLANTLYLLAAWQHPFSERKTTPSAFHRESGMKVDVPTMHMNVVLPYFEDEQVQVLQLPYQATGLSMWIALPRKGQRLSDLEADLGPELLRQWRSRMSRDHTVEIALPRFTIETSTDLRRVLPKLGIRSIFDSNRSSFPRVCRGEGLYVSAADHHVFLGVTEHGTEAAAATVYKLSWGMSGVEPKNVRFHADHPFLFILHDDASGAVLFMGRVADPTERMD